MHETPGQELFRLRLESPHAHARASAAGNAGAAGAMDLVPRLKELVHEDRAPFVITRGAGTLVAEVRFAALSALETLYGNRGMPPDFGAVPVRKAMKASEVMDRAKSALGQLGTAEAASVRGRVEAYLEQRVRPFPKHRELAYGYCTLQELGKVSYRKEEVNAQTYMTPTQEEIRRSQLASPRPVPHVRVASVYDPTRTLGFVYRDDAGQWGLDFAEGFEAAHAERQAIEVLTLDKKTVPRLKYRDNGEPFRSTDGSFVFDGSLDKKTGDPVLLGRTIAAFVGRRFIAELVTE
ncbi:MAG: hypothetical protein AAGA56_13960 [Myxococcota bacterium]